MGSWLTGTDTNARHHAESYPTIRIPLSPSISPPKTTDELLPSDNRLSRKSPGVENSDDSDVETGERSKLEQKREKNRVKQRNLRRQ